MARKAVLSGGRRDEIIAVAMRLFFEHGYEATSVRMIMDAVGGEIGMFYHYFKSKDALFNQVAERFFLDFEAQFEAALAPCTSPEDFVDTFLPLYETAMAQYRQLEGKMHWSVRYALHTRTVASLVPVVAKWLETLGLVQNQPTDILAGQLVFGISGMIHTPSFEAMEPAERRACLISYITSLLQVPPKETPT